MIEHGVKEGAARVATKSSKGTTNQPKRWSLYITAEVIEHLSDSHMYLRK